MYKKLYFMMFNRMTDAVNALKEGRSDDALQTLQGAQKEAEWIFVESGEERPPVQKIAQGFNVSLKKQKPPLCQVTVFRFV